MSAKFNFLPHGYPISAIFQPQQGQNNNVLEFAEVVAITHYLYNIEQIFVGHQISLSDAQLIAKPEMLLLVRFTRFGCFSIVTKGVAIGNACVMIERI